MAVLKRQFHHHEHGQCEEDTYSLARDTDTGEVFIIAEWSRPRAGNYHSGEQRLTVASFLAASGAQADKLRDLIGSLVTE